MLCSASVDSIFFLLFRIYISGDILLVNTSFLYMQLLMDRGVLCQINSFEKSLGEPDIMNKPVFFMFDIEHHCVFSTPTRNTAPDAMEIS